MRERVLRLMNREGEAAKVTPPLVAAGFAGEEEAEVALVPVREGIRIVGKEDDAPDPDDLLSLHLRSPSKEETSVSCGAATSPGCCTGR